MKKVIKIGNRLVGEGQPILVIAEAGINHQGDISIAKKLIDVAVESGADVVKFQKRKLDRILTKEGLEKEYDNPNSFGKTYGEHKLALELSEDSYKKLKEYTDKKNIIFTASPWDEESADFLENLGVKVFKTASADLTNHPLLDHIAKKQIPMIISTGMANMIDVEEAYKVVSKHNNQIILLHCVSTYPAKFEHLNLKSIHSLRERFGVPVGYSGHELGIAVGSAVTAMGVAVIERHFTLDRTMKGGDHSASLEPSGLEKLIRDIRAIEQALGDGVKRLIEEEKPIKEKLAKSIVSKVVIKKGTVIKRDMLTTKGPGTGIPPSKMKEVIGKKAKKTILEDSVIKKEHIVWIKHRKKKSKNNERRQTK